MFGKTSFNCLQYSSQKVVSKGIAFFLGGQAKKQTQKLYLENKRRRKREKGGQKKSEKISFRISGWLNGEQHDKVFIDNIWARTGLFLEMANTLARRKWD